LEEVETVPGTDGRKMSKSYGNYIPLFGTDEEIKKSVMSIVTDSKTPAEAKNPDEIIIYQLYKLVTPEKSIEMKERFEKGGLGYGEAKTMLYDAIIEMIAPMRELRKKYEDNPALVQEILEKGKQKARLISEAKMEEVRSKAGLK